MVIELTENMVNEYLRLVKEVVGDSLTEQGYYQYIVFSNGHFKIVRRLGRDRGLEDVAVFYIAPHRDFSDIFGDIPDEDRELTFDELWEKYDGDSYYFEYLYNWAMENDLDEVDLD